MWEFMLLWHIEKGLVIHLGFIDVSFWTQVDVLSVFMFMHARILI